MAEHPLAHLSFEDVLRMAADSLHKKKKHADNMKRYRDKNVEHFRAVWRAEYHKRQKRLKSAAAGVLPKAISI